MGACEFVLGTHRLNWAWRRGPWRALFLNAHLLMTPARGRQRASFGAGLRLRPTPLPRARCPIDLDSGGFLEVQQHGAWRWTPREHIELCRRVAAELGRLRSCAIQDWLCTPAALARTGLPAAVHQRRTLRSYLTLVELAPELPWSPVLQGALPDDYLRHADAYELAGVALASRRVMIGSIAARDDDLEIARVVSQLQSRGLVLHGLGVKGEGLRRLAPWLNSADSTAWALRGRNAERSLRRALGLDPRATPEVIGAALRGSPLARTRNGLLFVKWGGAASLSNSWAWAAEWGRRQQQIADSVASHS